MDKSQIQMSVDGAIKLVSARRLPEAEETLRRVLAVQPEHPVAMHIMAVVMHQTNRSPEALEWARRAVARQTNEAEFRNTLGVIAMNLGQFAEAEAAYRKSMQLRPTYVTALNNLAQMYMATGRLNDAVAIYRQAIQIAPNDPTAALALSSALISSGRLDEALGQLQRLSQIQPNNPDIYNLMGNALMMKGEPIQAIQAYRRSVAVMPTFAGGHSNLGNALQQTGSTEEALIYCQNALKYDPNLADAHNNMGNTLKDLARLDEACVHYRKAVALKPDTTIFFTNLVYAMWFRQACDPAEILAESRLGAKIHADPLTPRPAYFTNDRTPGKRIRIGYVSGDFRAHPVGRFMAPLITNHNKANVEVLLFSNVAKPDFLTHRIYAGADKIIQTNAMNDAAIAEAVKREGVDVLVDLSLHMAGTRLPLFARKPAPLNFTYLAYCATSGIDAMDYCVTDVNLDPITEPIPEGEAGPTSPWHSERLLHLKQCYWCYPPPDEAPPFNASPAERNGFVTFGSFNSFTKLNPGVIDLWATLMRSLPTSRMYLVVPGGIARQTDVANAFRQRGVDPGRLRMGGITSVPDYFKIYLDTDIALDPFPYCGGTTTMDALWMGLPVVTMAGRWATARAGVTILKNVGIPQWISNGPEQYLEIARSIAGDIPALAQWRRTLRAQMAASPLMDGKRFAADYEEAVRRAWDVWCVKGGKTSMPA
jgi:predicted O-linked N-acetylglucosamine transferase (SPINDLY family)